MSVSVHQMSDADYRTTLRTTTESADRTKESGDGFGALETEHGNLPLESLNVRADVTGTAAEIELTQGFRNPYPEPLEATYIFPLPDRAAVTAMRMTAGDRTIDGVLKERGEARADYDKAIAKGKRASIAEEERPNVFTMRVGNILPGERVIVMLRMAIELAYEDGIASLRFPLVVAPRYIPGEPLETGTVGTGTELDTDAVPDASRITPPVLLPGCPNPIQLGITADIDPAGLPLDEVTSSLHPVKVEELPTGRTHVEVHPGERADRDFVLCLRLADENAISAGLSVVPDAEQSGEGSFALTVLPPTGTVRPKPRDVVLVLDRSGSMTGWKMVAARRAAARIVDTLTSRDRFSVIAFDNAIETPTTLPDGLVEATDRHRFRAVEHLARLEARGGTEMLAPLQRAAKLLSGATDPDRERTLVLVTDGQIGNEDQILRELADRVSDARIHAVGIDRAVNSGFLHRIAVLGGGRCELVESEDRLDAAMEAIHRRVGTPLVTDLELAPTDLDVITETVSPGKLPALYAGAPLVIHGRYRGAGEPAGSITVRGRTTEASDWTRTIPAAAGSNTALAAVWARAHIRDLEDRYVTLRRGRGPEAEKLEQDIVATSLRFKVLSRFTAYVAVDTEVVNEGGTVRRVTQPVDTPQGWEMYGQQPAAAPMLASMRRTAMAAGDVSYAAESAVTDSGPVAGLSAQLQSRAGGAVRHILGRAAGVEEPTEPAAPPEPAELGTARQTLADWLTRLRATDATNRADLLAELATTLDSLLATLDRGGIDVLVVRPLRDLRDALRAALPDGPARAVELERRRVRALDVLEALVNQPPETSRRRIGRPTPRSGPFWKR